MARQRGNSWQGDYTMPDGSRKRRSFKTKAEALEFERFGPEGRQPRRVIPKYRPLVGELFPSTARDLWEGSKDWRNCERITAEWVKLLGSITPIDDVTTAKVMGIVRQLKAKGNKAGTINTKLVRLRRIMARLKKRGIVAEIPDYDREKGVGKRLRYLTHQEVDKLFALLSEDDRRLCTFLLQTGCRVSEALKLKWCDITETHVTFWQTKNGNPKTLPLSAQAKQAVTANAEREYGPFHHIEYHKFYKRWIRARNQAGFRHDKDVVPHILRHTCASWLVQKGVSIPVVQQYLGHSTIMMTMRYAHLAPNSLNIAAETLSTPVDVGNEK